MWLPCNTGHSTMNNNPLSQKKPIGLILAGGQARRMHGQDKGLIQLNEQTLIEHVIQRFAPQVSTIYISANRHISEYEQFGYKVLPDIDAAFAGPLAGMYSFFSSEAKQPIVVAPCDTPLLPQDLVTRLLNAYIESDCAVIPHDGTRLQPLFGLYLPTVKSSLESYLQSGKSKVIDWVMSLNPRVVDFSDEQSAFTNINTPDDLNCVVRNTVF